MGESDNQPSEPQPTPVDTTDAPFSWSESSRQESTSPERPNSRAAGDDEAPSQFGRYRVTGCLGRGSYGKVYRCWDDELKRDVAVKVPHPELIDNAELYRAEAQIVASLKHLHIVPVYDFGCTDAGLCYVVSEFIEGTTLADRMRENRLPCKEAAGIVASVAGALHHAHLHRVVHRDIKPANVLLDAAGKPYVADFGLALTDERFGQGPSQAGTLAYMSPEQARGESHLVDGRSDIFSLAVVFYELLTQKRPFRGASHLELLEDIKTREARPPRQLDDSIPMELERICLKALSKRATDRYSTALDMAEDLRQFLSPPPSPPTPTSSQAQAPSVPPAAVKIVPKGLRSFDGQDADFFLELLAGPRDRDGLPESIRFWKYRIEDTGPDPKFRVGLIYGPSGCGKSSFVKAGLLPHLDGPLTPIYIEATAEDTETRLLRGLRARCPQLSADLDLKGSIAAIRNRHGLPADKKLLVVIDQFEQWLHVNRAYENTPLVEALRQCDGERVQCIVMVRDDFWMKVTRFLRELDIRLVDGENSAAVDLFDLAHARSVLEAFGRALRKFPDKPAQLSREQAAFLQQATTELAEEGKIVCVRLALFADMMKGKPWTPATLKSVGGIAGVGVTFLEETFSAATAPPQHRYHQKAARAVLRELMPASRTAIKGKMRPADALLEASGYAGKTAEFDELIRILDTEVRLITPTDPEGRVEDGAAPPAAPEGQKCYQLTHDYLVPALRDWLTRKDKETRPGRARLLLDERTREWAGTNQDRFLPSFRESLFITLFTRSKARAPLSREMLRRAFWVHGMRIGVSAALLAVFALIIWRILPRQSMDLLRDRSLTSRARLEVLPRLALADPGVFNQVLEILDTDTDKDLLSGLVDAVRADVQKDPEVNRVRRESFASSLQKLLARVTLPADVRLIALRSLALGNAAVFDTALTTLDEDKDPRFITALVEAIRADLTRDPKHDRGRGVKFAESLGKLLRNPRQPVDIRILALAALPSDAGSSGILEIFRQIETQESRDPRLVVAMAGNVEQLGLDQIDEANRSAALRQLVGLLRESRDKGLVAACVRQLDKYHVDMLCGWFITAFRNDDQKTAAGGTIVPYFDALLTRGNQQRTDEIGEWIQTRLVETIDKRPPGESVTSFELEYLVQSIGLLQSRTADPHDNALRAVAKLLRGWTENRDCLDTVIESYVELKLHSSGADAPVPLREILRKREAGRYARIAAAKALGRLYVLDSMGELIVTAKDADDDPKVRAAAIRGLAQIGEKLAREGKDLKHVRRALEEIIDRKDPSAPYDAEVIDAGLRAFMLLGESNRAQLLFPWILRLEIFATATEAVSTMIQRTRMDAPDIITVFLEWLSKQKIPADLPPPVLAIAEMETLAPSLPAEVKAEARKSVLCTLKNLQRRHPDPGVRKLAAQCLENLHQPHDSAVRAIVPP